MGEKLLEMETHQKLDAAIYSYYNCSCKNLNQITHLALILSRINFPITLSLHELRNGSISLTDLTDGVLVQ